MRILVVAEYFFPTIMGGGQVNLDLLTRHLVMKGIEVHVLTSHQKGLQVEEEREGVHIHRLLRTANSAAGLYNNYIRSSVFPQSVAKQVRAFVANNKIDAIHLTGSSLIAAPELKDLSIPVIATIESYPALCPKGDRIYHGKRECTIVCSKKEFTSCQRSCASVGKSKNKWYIKYNPIVLRKIYSHYQKMQQSLQHCHIIAISKYIQEILAKHNLASTVIGNGLEIEKFNEVKATKANHEKPSLLFLGSLIESKGPQVIVEATKDLDCHIDLYGSGVLEDELTKKITHYNIDATIHAPVGYDKIPQIYSNSDIVIFPSIWPEPFGRIAIEAQAAAKIVIASAIGGIKETIVDKKTGLLVNPGSSMELKEAIEKIRHSPDLRREIEKNALKSAKQHDIKEVSKKLVDFYNQIISKHNEAIAK